MSHPGSGCGKHIDNDGDREEINFLCTIHKLLLCSKCVEEGHK
jgi:hypothetical protein